MTTKISFQEKLLLMTMVVVVVMMMMMMVMMMMTMMYIHIGGSVAEWLERRTCNSEVPSSSPALTSTELDLLSVVPSSNPRPRL